jgi:orotate phosphoribosyltransferase
VTTAAHFADHLLKQLIHLGAIKQGNFTLSSGSPSNYYVDLRQGLCWPNILRSVAAEVVRRVRRTHGPVDAWAGVAVGAVPLAAACAIESGLPFFTVRKEAKAHGTGKLVEGPDLTSASECRVVLVEDVMTTGGSARAAMKHLADAGAKVAGVVAVFDRLQGGAAHVQDVPGDVFFEALSDLGHLRAIWPGI